MSQGNLMIPYSERIYCQVSKDFLSSLFIMLTKSSWLRVVDISSSSVDIGSVVRGVSGASVWMCDVLHHRSTAVHRHCWCRVTHWMFLRSHRPTAEGHWATLYILLFSSSLRFNPYLRTEFLPTLSRLWVTSFLHHCWLLATPLSPLQVSVVVSRFSWNVFRRIFDDLPWFRLPPSDF